MRNSFPSATPAELNRRPYTSQVLPFCMLCQTAKMAPSGVTTIDGNSWTFVVVWFTSVSAPTCVTVVTLIDAEAVNGPLVAVTLADPVLAGEVNSPPEVIDPAPE